MIERLLSNNFAVMRYMPHYTRRSESDVKVKKANIALLSYFSLDFYVGITQGLIINYIEFKPVLDV
ncbi:hypothetical protein FGD84_11430 [Escherichia coli]|nr:hypothetical protein [Escherichia coli]